MVDAFLLLKRALVVKQIRLYKAKGLRLAERRSFFIRLHGKAGGAVNILNNCGDFCQRYF